MNICHISHINNKQKIIKLAERIYVDIGVWCTKYMTMKAFSRIMGNIDKLTISLL